MYADEPNLRIYERAFTGRNGGKGSAPAAPAPIRLTHRDFVPMPRREPVPQRTPSRAAIHGAKLAAAWRRIPGTRATLAGVAALPLRAGLWWLNRWKLTLPATAVALVALAHIAGPKPRTASEVEGEMMLLHAAARVVEARKENPGLTPADLVDNLGLRPEELIGRHYAADRTVTIRHDGGMRILGLPLNHNGPVLMIEISPAGVIQMPAKLTPAP